MVDIPLARDINRISSNSGRGATSAPSNPIGGALANSGQGLQQVSYHLNSLRADEINEGQAKVGYDVQLKLAEFRDAEEKSFNAARENSSESGIGFTRSFIEGYEKRADDFVKSNFAGLTEAQNAQARQTLLGFGNSLYDKSYAYENQAKSAYYDRSTNSGLDLLRTQIRGNAAPSDQLRRQGEELINAANMPEPWKAARRQEWARDAEESNWQWKFTQNPEQAVRDLGVTTSAPLNESIGQTIDAAAARHGVDGSVLRKIAQVESGGRANAKNPSSSAGGLFQFIDSTASQYGLKDRFDPVQAADAGARLLKDNRDALASALGREPSAGELYLAHQQGAGGAIKLLSNPNAPASSIVGAEAVRLNLPAGQRDRASSITAGEFANLWGQKIEGRGIKSSPEFDNIPYERRVQLATAGEAQINQQTIAARSAARESYSLLIQTNPAQIDENVILRDSVLDNGDKAQLINSLRSEREKGASAAAFISQLRSGDVNVNPFDSDQTKVANKAYDQLIASATTPQQRASIASNFVASTGYIPDPVQAEIRSGAISTEPPVVAQAMQAASIMRKNAPISFQQMAGSEAVQKKLDLYQTYTTDMGYTPEQAAKRIVDLDNPEAVRQREALLKSDTVKKSVKAIDSGDVAAVFDKGVFSFAPSVGGNPLAEAAITDDYRSFYQEALLDSGGDPIAAKKVAGERFKRTYAPSEYALPTLRGTVIKNAPEAIYPPVNGSHSYIKEQLESTLKTLNIQNDGVFLQPYDQTEKDKRAGIPPAFQVYYMQNGKLEMYPKPFFADVEAAKREEKERQASTLRAFDIANQLTPERMQQPSRVEVLNSSPYIPTGERENRGVIGNPSRALVRESARRNSSENPLDTGAFGGNE